MSWAVYDDGAGPTVYKTSCYSNFIERLQDGQWVPMPQQGLWPDAQTLTVRVFQVRWGSSLHVFASRRIGTTSEYGLFRWNTGSWINQGICGGPCDGYDSVGGQLTFADLGAGPTLYATAAPHDPPFPNDYAVVEFRDGHWVTIGMCPRFVNSLIAVDTPSGAQRLCAIGTLTAMNGVPAMGIAWWNGATWIGSSGPEFNGDNAVIADLGGGRRIYCEGTLYDGLNRSGVYRWDDDHWTFIGGPDPLPPPSTPPYITNLGVFDDGRGEALYIGGIFRGFAGVTARNVVRCDGQSFEPLGAGIVGEPKWFGGFRDIRGWTMFIGGDVLTGAGAGTLQQSAALWVGCKEDQCYANCDLSPGPPRLTANDFMCFLNAYVRRDPYANCTVDADINAADFMCFMNKFAAGCP